MEALGNAAQWPRAVAVRWLCMHLCMRDLLKTSTLSRTCKEYMYHHHTSSSSSSSSSSRRSEIRTSFDARRLGKRAYGVLTVTEERLCLLQVTPAKSAPQPKHCHRLRVSCTTTQALPACSAYSGLTRTARKRRTPAAQPRRRPSNHPRRRPHPLQPRWPGARPVACRRCCRTPSPPSAGLHHALLRRWLQQSARRRQCQPRRLACRSRHAGRWRRWTQPRGLRRWPTRGAQTRRRRTRRWRTRRWLRPRWRRKG